LAVIAALVGGESMSAVSVPEEVERTRPWRSRLVAAFAILLAVAPSLGRSPSIGLAPIAAAIDASVPQQGDLAKTTSQVQPASLGT
jgi:hypothetical protein